MSTALIKKIPFWAIVAISFGVLAFFSWAAYPQIEAHENVRLPGRVLLNRPLQQSCTDAPDLVIQSITINPNPPGAEQFFNVQVEIMNNGIITGTVDTWAFLYMDKAPDVGVTPDVQASSPTTNMAPGETRFANLTVPGSFATPGFHSLVIRIDATGQITESALCAGEDNNISPITFEITAIFPTATTPPTPTPFPAPQIYFFNAGPTTVSRGDPVRLHWQVYGEAVNVYLDGQPVSMEQMLDVYPDQNHVYTLSAENPGGHVEKTQSIIVVVPSPTPTHTPLPCPLAVIHSFGATRTTIARGEKTTLYWDLSGATEAYLNGDGVQGVASREVTLQQTTTFVLIAHNQCGDVQSTITINVTFATPSATPSPTYTATATRTPTPTSTPGNTPTPRILTPTPTNPPPVNTITPYPTITPTPMGADSPLPTPLPTSTEMISLTLTMALTPTDIASPTGVVSPTSVVSPTNVVSPTGTPSQTPTHSPTPTTVSPLPVPTLTRTPVNDAVVPAITVVPTAVPTRGNPLPTPTLVPSSPTVRMYLCPLSVLLLFAIGVIVLSFALPRIRQRREAQSPYSPPFGEADLGAEGSLLQEPQANAAPALFQDGEFVELEVEEMIVKHAPDAHTPSSEASPSNDGKRTGLSEPASSSVPGGTKTE